MFQAYRVFSWHPLGLLPFSLAFTCSVLCFALAWADRKKWSQFSKAFVQNSNGATR